MRSPRRRQSRAGASRTPPTGGRRARRVPWAHRGLVERIATREPQLELREVVEAPEEILTDRHRRDAEHAARDRRIGLLAEARLGGRLRRLVDDRGPIEADA